MAINLLCPHCGGGSSAPDGALGRSGTCPHCDRDVLVQLPAVGVAAPPPPPVIPVVTASLRDDGARYPSSGRESRVVVVDFDMRFGSLVWFLVKLSLAAIPAGLLLGLIGYAVALVVAAMVGGWAAPRP